MFKAATANTQKKDSKKAAEDLLNQAFANLDRETADLAFVFASFHTYDHATLVKTLYSSGKIKNLVGGTTSGEIYGNAAWNNSAVILLLAGSEVRLKTAVHEVTYEKPVEDAAKLAQLLQEGENGKPALVILIGAGGAGTPFAGDAALVGMQSVFGEKLPIVGGGCGDELTFTQPLLYFQDQVLSLNKAAAVALYGKVNFGVGVRHGWERIGKTYEITKAEGYLLQELEGKKPRDLYLEKLGDQALEKLNDPKSGVPMIYPLGLEIGSGGELLVRTPVMFNEDGSVVIGGVGKVGQRVCLTVGSQEKILEATGSAAEEAKKALGHKKPSVILFFDCISRKLVMGTEVSKEAASLQKYFPSSPVIGFYTYGEFAPASTRSKKSVYHNQSAVILALA